jgi:hypothetical protein
MTTMVEEMECHTMSNRGPRSASGKAAVSHNSLNHGLTAAAVILPSESQAVCTSFHDELLIRLDAEGPAELALASRAAELLWRLRRAARAEAQSVSVAQTHRDVIVFDRQQTERSAVSDPGADGAASQGDAREQLTKQLGIYARGEIANGAAARFQETLPVLLPNDQRLETILRYETQLSRLLKHALHELEALQDRRRGNPTPVKRIDIN